jgi:hypothetical protein
MDVSFSFEGEMWIYAGNAAWCFITLPVEYAEDIKAIAGPRKRGFGSLRVKATIGAESWRTSIFPDTKSKSYVLPIKKEIRKKCGIQAGDTVNVEVALVDF